MKILFIHFSIRVVASYLFCTTLLNTHALAFFESDLSPSHLSPIEKAKEPWVSFPKKVTKEKKSQAFLSDFPTKQQVKAFQNHSFLNKFPQKTVPPSNLSMEWAINISESDASFFAYFNYFVEREKTSSWLPLKSTNLASNALPLIFLAQEQTSGMDWLLRYPHGSSDIAGSHPIIAFILREKSPYIPNTKHLSKYIPSNSLHQWIKKYNASQKNRAGKKILAFAMPYRERSEQYTDRYKGVAEIKITPFYFPNAIYAFQELYLNSKRKNTEKEVHFSQPLPTRFDSMETGASGTGLNHLSLVGERALRSFYVQRPEWQERKGFELKVTPHFSRLGEILKLYFLIRTNGGKTLKQFEYVGQYQSQSKFTKDVDEVQMLQIKGKIFFLPAKENALQQHNQNMVLTLVESFKKDYSQFIDNSYLIPLEISTSLDNTDLYLDNQFIGRYSQSPVKVNVKRGVYRISATKEGISTSKITLNTDRLNSKQVFIPMDTSKYTVKVGLQLYGEGRTIQARLGKQNKEFSQKTIFKQVPKGERRILFNQYHGAKDISLMISEPKDRQVHLLRNMRSKLNQEQFWKVKRTSATIGVQFTPKGLLIQGKNVDSRLLGSGIYSPPFHLYNFKSELRVQKLGKGVFVFSLVMGEKHRILCQWEGAKLIISDKSKKISHNTIAHLNHSSNKLILRVEKKEEKLIFYAGDNEIGNVKIPRQITARFYFGADSHIQGEDIQFNLSHWQFNHL